VAFSIARRGEVEPGVAFGQAAHLDVAAFDAQRAEFDHVRLALVGLGMSELLVLYCAGGATKPNCRNCPASWHVSAPHGVRPGQWLRDVAGLQS
jgi:hypothetical protein